MTEPQVATVKTGVATSGQTGTLAAMIDGEVRCPFGCRPAPCVTNSSGKRCRGETRDCRRVASPTVGQCRPSSSPTAPSA